MGSLSVSRAAAWCIALVAVLLVACGAMPGRDSDAKVLLVIGATGGTGQEVVKQALAAGYSVRALVRDEAKARDALGAGVQYFVGNVRQPETLDAAFRGAEFVVSALGSNSRRDPENKPEAIDYLGVKAIAEKAKAADVKHVVLVSSMGVTDPDHMLNKVLDNILVWKLRGENALRESGVRYTVVRPGGLSNNPGGTTGIRVMQGDQKGIVAQIPRADVAAVCVAALGRKDAYGKTLEIISDPNAKRADLTTIFDALKPDAK
jgi:uncharacterized protein YbjT (DUF2867 family)